MSAFEIEIRNEAKNIRVPAARLKLAARKILKSLGLKGASLSILLVNDRAIRRLNRRYLGHDRATDVIAFPQKKPFLGDIVISLETTKRQAKEYGNSFDYELCFYLCHGVLHLMGFEDKTKKQSEKMLRKQEKILRKIGTGSHPRPFAAIDR